MTARTSPINGALVRTRRLELGLSQRRLARESGFGYANLRDIEENDGQNRTITVAELVRLADGLDLEPGRLIGASQAAPAPPAAEPAAVATADDDSRAVAQLLLEARSLVYVDDVAHAMGWTYHRTSEALRALDARLAGTGLHVHRCAGRTQIRPLDPPADLTTRVANAMTARVGISSAQAKILYARLTGEGKDGRIWGPGDKRGRPTLLLLGLLKDDGGRQTSIGDDLRYALDL